MNTILVSFHSNDARRKIMSGRDRDSDQVTTMKGGQQGKTSNQGCRYYSLQRVSRDICVLVVTKTF